MLEVLALVLKVGGVIGGLSGAIVAIKQRSLVPGAYVFAGSILTCMVGVLGLISLLKLLVILQDPQMRADSPPAAAAAAGYAVLLFVLVPLAIAGAYLGNVAYQKRQDQRR